MPAGRSSHGGGGRHGPILLSAAAALGLAGTSILAFAPARADQPPAGDFAPGYAGSASCAPCHAKEYGEWKASLHSKMEQPATPKTVLGTWSAAGTVVPVEAPGKRIAMIREGDDYVVEAPDAEGKPRRYKIERTVGNRYKQRYLTHFPDGSWQAMPVQWLEKDQKFVEWQKMASTTPGSGDFWADTAWQWQLKCAGCHTTGLDLGYDPKAKAYETRWKELAIGCESCHGPSQAHVTAGGGTANVLCPSKMTHVQQLDTCGKCHSRGTSGPKEGAPEGLPGRLAYPYNMVPGEPLDTHFAQAMPHNAPKEFWPDESSFNHHQQLTDYRRSGMLIHGGDRAPTCTTCHEPHRAADLRAPVADNSLCLTCHTAFREAPALSAHTGHGSDPAKNAGARCVECHMPRIVNHAGTVKLTSHTYWSPDPRRLDRDAKTPMSCLLCHRDRDRSWALAAAERFWPLVPAKKEVPPPVPQRPR